MREFLVYENQLELKELIELITSLTSQYGTKAKVEYWAVTRRCFLAEGIDGEEWHQAVAERLNLSDTTCRQRQFQFKRWISPLLESRCALPPLPDKRREVSR